MRKDSNSSSLYIWLLVAVAVFVLVSGALILAYITFVYDLKLGENTIGPLGDFYGGLLNPLLSFISIIFVVYALLQNQRMIKMSSDELKLTREEHKRTADAQREIAALELSRQETEKEFFNVKSILDELNFRTEMIDDLFSIGFLEMSERKDLNITEIGNDFFLVEALPEEEIKGIITKVETVYIEILEYTLRVLGFIRIDEISQVYYFEVLKNIQLLNKYKSAIDELVIKLYDLPACKDSFKRQENLINQLNNCEKKLHRFREKYLVSSGIYNRYEAV